MTIGTSDQGSAQVSTYPDLALGRSTAVSGDRARAVFGQVMGLVAMTLGCLALGAYVGRDLNGGLGILFFIGGFGCIIGLNVASGRGHEQLSITLLFGLGLLLGLALGPVVNAYAKADPSAVWQAAGATGARERDLVGCKAGDLRRVHARRLQPPASRRRRERSANRREYLPRHPQRVSIHAGAVRRRARLAPDSAEGARGVPKRRA